MSRRLLSRQLRIANLAAHLIIWLSIGFACLPFAWMVISSVRDPSEIFDLSRMFVPHKFAIEQNYGQVLGNTPILRFMLNGVIVLVD